MVFHGKNNNLTCWSLIGFVKRTDAFLVAEFVPFTKNYNFGSDGKPTMRMMEDWSKSTLFKGMLSIERENSFLVNGFFKVGNRFSLWKDESNFTAGQIEKVCNDTGYIFPGETAMIEFSAINSKVTLALAAGDSVFFGVPYTTVGTLKIQEILTLDFKTP